ncbi:MAG: HD-GYP domain-containing protein [Gammaproteobacteria bacterium]|nr:HD-GYP domain-containing protein [Gammaproteobacteria bacterium]
MDRKVSTACLKIGMYVSRLDRPWVQTPFLIQGFFIKDDNEISLLVKYCDFVFIDTELGVDADMYFDNPRAQQAKLKTSLSTNTQVEAILDMDKKLFDYVDKSTTVEELPEAKQALEKATECVAEIIEHDIHKGKLDIVKVNNAVEPILESMIRNSDAFMWLSKMRLYDAYSYEHSLQNCALGIAFGRHMGLSKKALNTLAVGLLLMDVGKIKLPKELLTKSEPLTPAETEIMHKHVAYSVEMLRNTKGISEHVINVALTHHERYDGSGYPNGLVGVQTPAYGRMAAIIDCYDSMITATPYRNAISEHKALQSIYNLRNKHFQTELVEKFMQCMGVYPTGSLVELSSGEVGAVLSQNTQQKLRPKIILLLDEEKRPYKKRRVFDLAMQKGVPVHIAKSLENHSYGVDVKQIRI